MMLLFMWVSGLRGETIPNSNHSWYHSVRIGMEVGPTGPQSSAGPPDMVYARKFNGGDILRESIQAGSEYMVIWGRDGEFSYYNSKIQPKAPGLGHRDPLQEAVDVARESNHPLIVYCVLQYPAHDLRNHPEWRMVEPDGKPIDYLVCYNSPYREHVLSILDELMEYDMDGFHLDMVDQGFGPPHGCWCSHCQSLFEKTYHQPMPAQAKSWDADWDRILEFRYESSRRFEVELVEHIRRTRPGLTVDFNYHGNPPFSWEVGQLPVMHANTADFVTGETGLWGFSALGVGLNAQFYRAATPGKPYQVAIQRGVRMYHDQTTRPLNDMLWETMTLLSHGAFVTMIDKTAFDGSLDPIAYQRFGQLFKEVRRKKNLFGHTPVYDVGLYFSSRSRDWYGRDEPARYFKAFQGAHKACVYDHLQFGVLHSDNLSLDGMRQFPVICIPNAPILHSENEVELFRRYVQMGGHLVITGWTGTMDWTGKPQPVNALAALQGAEVVSRMDTTDNWVSLPTAEESPFPEWTGTIPGNWPFLVRGPGVIYRATTAQTIGQLWRPHRSVQHALGQGNPEWPMSPSEPVGPAILVHSIPNGGKVVTIASSPDYSCATDHYLPETRRLLTQIIRQLNPNPPVQVTAPAHVETVITHEPDRKRYHVHYIAYNSVPQTTPAKDRPYVLPGLIEDTPMFRTRITTAWPIEKATSFNSNSTLPAHDKSVETVIEGIHETISIQY